MVTWEPIFQVPIKLLIVFQNSRMLCMIQFLIVKQDFEKIVPTKGHHVSDKQSQTF